MPPVASVRVRHASHLFSGLIMLNEKGLMQMKPTKALLLDAPVEKIDA